MLDCFWLGSLKREGISVSQEGVIGLYSDLSELRESPRWKLLRADKAPVVLACLSVLFSVGPDRVLPTSALHERLTRQIGLLRSLGCDLPQTPQQYVIEWLNAGWLRRDFPDESAEEVFELSTDGAEALRVVTRMLRPRSAATESRLASVLRLIQDLAAATNASPQARIDRLLEERARIDEEIDAVRSGRITTLEPQRARERAREAIMQGEDLIGDFDRVRDEFSAINQRLRRELVEGDGSKGEVLANVFDGIDVIRQTEAGKAFDAFWRLLTNPVEAARFEEALRQVVARAFASELDNEERRFLLRFKSRLLEQTNKINVVQSSFASSLQSFVRSREFSEHRRILRLLREAQQGALSLIPSVKLNQRLDFQLDRTSAAVKSVSQWYLHDPSKTAGSAQMEDAQASDARIEDIQAHIRRSEIDVRSLKRHIRHVLAEVSQASISQVLHVCPAEQGLGSVIGYIQLAVRHGVATQQRESVRWQGLDGIWRRADAPLFYFTRERLHELG
ncbi:DUF3375 domain-containing protein [Variovorax boronicumulans]|uniref:DUF3375 domain-containing protein n=1 Tax=Variovorax boronicumulans TaxID=436515 RepID=UPI00209C3423|nr:DUF3375 domain-containing protein [Variovorax boronicumulans]